MFTQKFSKPCPRISYFDKIHICFPLLCDLPFPSLQYMYRSRAPIQFHLLLLLINSSSRRLSACFQTLVIFEKSHVSIQNDMVPKTIMDGTKLKKLPFFYQIFFSKKKRKNIFERQSRQVLVCSEPPNCLRDKARLIVMFDCSDSSAPRPMTSPRANARAPASHSPEYIYIWDVVTFETNLHGNE